ncbi:DNA damage-inducible protein YebG [Thiorhodovibrio winogradskyi]|uniref:DNA damage-inducible protein YebG n=1 Tax=Thiorhodovibrio winogradskyi TaxID=77007 RepID=A0ABZ0S8C2_9GAMM|nr:YebG family protein [Thiorhodovibrio winogradskyi]
MIEIEYIVKDNQGVERLRTADKKEADAYDKALEVADRLGQWLRDEQVVPKLADEDLEELTIHLARNARVVERILKGKETEPAMRRSANATGSQSPANDQDHDGKEGPNSSADVRPLKATG